MTTYLSINVVKPTSAAGPSARKNPNIALWEVQKIKESVKKLENQSQKEKNSFDMWILKGLFLEVS